MPSRALPFRRMPHLTPLAMATLLLCAVTAGADTPRRALVEPREARASLQKVKVDLLKADPALAQCLPGRHLSANAADWACKVGALRAAAAVEKVNPDADWAANAGLRTRAQLVAMALETADALGWFAPAGGAPRELPAQQVAAQAEVCRAAQELYLLMADIPEQKPLGSVLVEGFPQKDVPRLAGRPLKQVACGCHERTQALGRAGFLSERDPQMAAAQSGYLGLACNLKSTGRESSLVAARRESRDVDLSAVGGSARGADVDRDEAQRVADRRKTELGMCVEARDRGAAGAEKMARCACPLAQRWRFARRDGDTPLSVKVQVSDKLPALTLEINAKGVVEKCSL